MKHLHFLLAFTLYSEILALTKDASVDLASILSHMNQLESGLQSTMIALQKNVDDLRSTKVELESTKSELKSTQAQLTTTMIDLKATKRELNRTSSELQATKGELNRTASDLHATVKQLSRTSSDLQATNGGLNRTASDLQATKEQLNRTSWDLQATKSALQDEKQQCTARITSLRNDLALKTKDVSFRVHWSGGNTNSHIPVKFDSVDHNAGNGYSTTTGKFTAPVSGTYIFSVQVELHQANQHTFINIVVSGSDVSDSFGRTSTDIDSITIPVTAITHVRQGEQVWVTSDYNVLIYGASYPVSLFSGALLSAD